MCLSPAERKSREVRAKWRQYHQEKHGFPSRFMRHHPNRISDDEYARREEVAQAIDPVLAQYELRRDMRQNLTALIAELTRVSISEKGKGDIDTGTRASIAVLATRLGLTRRTIQRRLRWLEARNLVVRIETRPEGKRQRANVYVLSRDMCRHAARVDIITRRRARQTQRAVRMLIRYPLPRPTLSPAEKEAEQTYIKNGFEQLLKEMKAKLKAKAKTTESGKERGRLPHKNLAWNGAERGAGIYDRASSSQHGTRKNVAPSSMLNEFSNRHNDAKAASFGEHGDGSACGCPIRTSFRSSHARNAQGSQGKQQGGAGRRLPFPPENLVWDEATEGAGIYDRASSHQHGTRKNARSTHDPHDNIGIFVEKLIAMLSRSGFHGSFSCALPRDHTHAFACAPCRPVPYKNRDASEIPAHFFVCRAEKPYADVSSAPCVASFHTKQLSFYVRLKKYVRRWLAAGAKPIDIVCALQSPHASEAQHLAYFTTMLIPTPA